MAYGVWWGPSASRRKFWNKKSQLCRLPRTAAVSNHTQDISISIRLSGIILSICCTPTCSFFVFIPFNLLLFLLLLLRTIESFNLNRFWAFNYRKEDIYEKRFIPQWNFLILWWFLLLKLLKRLRNLKFMELSSFQVLLIVLAIKWKWIIYWTLLDQCHRVNNFISKPRPRRTLP